MIAEPPHVQLINNKEYSFCSKSYWNGFILEVSNDAVEETLLRVAYIGNHI
jgi:hypothetical protein